MHPTRINNSCKKPNRRTIHAGSQSVGEVRNHQLSHSLMTGLQMDEHIARIALNQGATPQVKIYLTDALGSVIATAKADQSLEVGYAFSPYGQTQKVGVENQLAGSENSSQYTGRENDNNGLYFYRERYYDPVLKRFVSEDPIGLAGGWNMYAYVNGAPTMFTDPDGLRALRPPSNWYTNQPQLPAMPTPPPGPRPVPGWRPAPTVPNNNNGNNYADGAGTLTGGNTAGNHPGIPNYWDRYFDPFPKYPIFPLPPNCRIVSSPSPGVCPAVPETRMHCGPEMSQR